MSKLIDLHTHTSGISRCCRYPAEVILQTAKLHGFDGIALTNHFAKYYLEADGYHGFVDRYLDEYEKTRKLGEGMELSVYFGVELSMEYDRRMHILLYGADGDFLHAHPELFDLTPSELYGLCRREHICLIHAHPYRGGTRPWPTDCVDGYEINCHPLYDATHAEELLTEQRGQGFLLTCGCDYHGDTYRAHGGVFLPETVQTSRELADYLQNTRSLQLQYHELYWPQIHRTEISVKHR